MKSKESKYIRTSKLGEGTYGVVYRAKDQKGQEIYALKKNSLTSRRRRNTFYCNKRNIPSQRINSY